MSRSKLAKYFLTSMVICNFVLPASAANSDLADQVSKCFVGFDGTFVLRDTSGKDVVQYNSALANKNLSPCSTFKIVIGLIGLETGVIKDENTPEKWDGVKQENEVWNKDYNLKAAMDESVNWYFNRVTKKVGEKEIAKYLRLLHYGNEDISSGLDNFWMGTKGSLRITPSQQVDFLEKLYAEKLPLSVRSQQIVKRILKVDENNNGTLYGKTGTDSKDGKMVAGWFAGFIESKKGNGVFATYIEGKTGILGRKARETSKKILTELGYW